MTNDKLNNDLNIDGKFKGNGIELQTLLFKRNIPIIHTGVTGETVIATYLIPGGTLQGNDILKWYLYYTMTNNANAKEYKAYFNTTPDLIGSPVQVGVRNTVSVGGSAFGRELIFQNSLTNQRIWIVTSNLTVPEVAVTSAMSSLTIDFTVDQYLVLTNNLAVGTDNITTQWFWTKILR